MSSCERLNFQLLNNLFDTTQRIQGIIFDLVGDGSDNPPNRYEINLTSLQQEIDVCNEQMNTILTAMSKRKQQQIDKEQSATQ